MKILIDTSTYPLDDMVDVQICDDSGTVTREYRGKPGGYLYVKTRVGDWRQVMRAPRGAEHGGGVDGVAVSVPHARAGESQRAALLGRIAEAVAADLVLGRDGTIAERVSDAFKGSGVTWQIVGARGESLRLVSVVETLSVRRETVIYATPDADAPDATSEELAWVFADGSMLCPYGDGAWDEPDRHPRNDLGQIVV